MRSYPDFLQIIERCAQLERAYTLLRPADAAKMLGVSKKQLYLLAKHHDFPNKIKIGIRAVGWKLTDLEGWIDSRSVNKGGL